MVARPMPSSEAARSTFPSQISNARSTAWRLRSSSGTMASSASAATAIPPAPGPGCGAAERGAPRENLKSHFFSS